MSISPESSKTSRKIYFNIVSKADILHTVRQFEELSEVTTKIDSCYHKESASTNTLFPIKKQANKVKSLKIITRIAPSRGNSKKYEKSELMLKKKRSQLEICRKSIIDGEELGNTIEQSFSSLINDNKLLCSNSNLYYDFGYNIASMIQFIKESNSYQESMSASTNIENDLLELLSKSLFKGI